MDEIEYALTLAARGRLPKSVGSGSQPSAAVVRELVEAGLLRAIDASSFDGEAFLEPRITLAGREHLRMLRENMNRAPVPASKEDSGMSYLGAAPKGNDAWAEIEREYGVSKRTLARRLSFVRDRFKRGIIFRDIEQAYTLAGNGFSKPSVILAGGVVEELLRLYLTHRGVKPADNSLDSYIKKCEELGYLKDAIHKLADSVRQFRNIVHLARESSARHTISKATAKGAVASVFTIVNDLRG